ncbi:hypothetical protein RIF29_21195 [Crotalaria pallida]|uniref:Uncharacterized protein n=1 Tax=Crotalaria pallida TaxID=3830 RepID=A0AAN9ID64_CROPI
MVGDVDSVGCPKRNNRRTNSLSHTTPHHTTTYHPSIERSPRRRWLSILHRNWGSTTVPSTPHHVVSRSDFSLSSLITQK